MKDCHRNRCIVKRLYQVSEEFRIAADRYHEENHRSGGSFETVDAYFEEAYSILFAAFEYPISRFDVSEGIEYARVEAGL